MTRELPGNGPEAASHLEHALPAHRAIVDQAAKEGCPRRLRKPGGAPEFAVDAAKESARGGIVGQVGTALVPEIVHWILVPPEANAAGDVVGGLRQG